MCCKKYSQEKLDWKHIYENNYVKIIAKYQNIKASLWLIIVNMTILIAGAYVGMCDIINEKTK